MSETEMVAIPPANRPRLGRSWDRSRDKIRIAVVMRRTSAKTSVSVPSREPLSWRSCLSRTNTHETTKSDVATIRPSSTSRRGLWRDRWDKSVNDTMAPTGYSNNTASAATGRVPSYTAQMTWPPVQPSRATPSASHPNLRRPTAERAAYPAQAAANMRHSTDTISSTGRVGEAPFHPVTDDATTTTPAAP